MDQKQIKDLIKEFETSRLCELTIVSEGFRITMKSPSGAAGGLPAQPAIPAPQTSAGSPPAPTQNQGIEGKRTDTEIINSPIVGTFYSAPAPDAPAFVEEGSKVSSGDSLCIIEAMKIMNKLEAEFGCEIIKILAENGQIVEYGTPLFEVKRV